MDAKKIIFIFFALVFCISNNAFAAGVTIFTQPYQRDANGNLIPNGVGSDGLPRFLEQCPPCAALDRALYQRDASGKIVKNLIDLGGVVTVTEEMPADRSITSIPTLVLPDGQKVTGPNPILGQAQAYIAQQANKPKPPAVTPTPKPSPTNIPKPSPVPPEQVPNKAFVNPITCTKVSTTKYSCEYTDSNGKKIKLDVTDTPDPNDFFDAIKSGVPILATDSGLFRPFPPKSDLSDKLPPVPGDPGYVVPKPPKGNEDWMPIPKPGVAPVVTMVDGVYVVTFPDGTQYKVTKGEYSKYIQGASGRDLLKSPQEIAVLIVANGVATGSKKPVPPGGGVTPPTTKPTPPPTAKSPHYKLEDPQPHKTLPGLWIIKGQMCTESACTPINPPFTVPAGSAEEARKIIETYLGGTPPPSGAAPQPYKRGATVKANEPAEVPNPENDAHRQMLERELKEIKEKNAAADKKERELEERLKKIEGKK